VKTSTLLIAGAVGVAAFYYFVIRPQPASTSAVAQPGVTSSAVGVQTLPNQPTDPGNPNNFLQSFLGSVLPGATASLTGALNSGLSSISGSSGVGTSGNGSTDTSSYDSTDYGTDAVDSNVDSSSTDYTGDSSSTDFSA